MKHSSTTMPLKVLPTFLALAATVSAVCLSILAGWQRGGLLAERVLLICVGIVLVVAAHLLPGLCRSHGWRIRALGAVLWTGCMVATCYGHAVFFVMAQQHAGELRAAAVSVIVPAVSTPVRNPAVIASDRAGVIARLAHLAERKCGERCAAARIKRTILTAQLVALDVESAEVTRRDLTLERADAERVAAKADPVAGLMTAFGLAASRVDLVAGMAFAVVLEGVACFCWLLALRPVEAARRPVTSAEEDSHELRVTSGSTDGMQVRNELPSPAEAVASRTSGFGGDLTKVILAIDDGTLRGTVAEIRKYLRCSQTKAATVRKQLARYTQTGYEITQAIGSKGSL